MGKLVISLAALMAVLAASGHAMAADEHMLAWDNFALRVLNVIIFIGIIWYAAGALIRKFFVGHREAVAREMAELERLKKERPPNIWPMWSIVWQAWSRNAKSCLLMAVPRRRA